MNQKYNQFQNLFETAFSHFSNGGFREGSALTLKPSFLKHPYCKDHYSGHEPFMNFLKQLIDNEVLFFVKRVVAHGTMQNSKDANSNEGAGDVYLVLRTDPRKVEWPTEFAEFTVPGSYEVLAVKDYGINLPPLDGVPNRYERPFGQDVQVFKMESSVNNRSTDDELPIKNVKLDFASDPQTPKIKPPKKLKN
jgi:hypothetical protein